MHLGNFKFLSSVLVSLHLLRGVTSSRELLSCTFETSCGLQYTRGSQFNWQRISGATPNSYTGPSNDHTFGNRNGQYIYAPSSVNYYDFGEYSTLYTPEYRLAAGRGRVEFYYHMYDGRQPDDMGTLEVYTCDTTQPTWVRRQNQGNRWLWSGQIDFTCNKIFRVYLIAYRGKYQSDIAIDDLIVTDVFEDPTTPILTTQQSTTTPTTPATTQLATTSTTTASITAPSTTTQQTSTRPPRTTPQAVQLTTVAPPPSTTLTPTKTIPVTKDVFTKIPEASIVTTPSNDATVAEVTVTMTMAPSVEPEVQTSLVPNNSATVDVSADPNLQSGSSSSSFVGPIVVLCVAVMFLSLTLCFAFKRKKRARKPTSKTSNDVRYSVENPSYCGVLDSDSATKDPKRANYSYQELLQQQSYNSIDETGRETDVEYNTVDSSDTAGANGDCSYQEIGKGAPVRRGESVLYAAIPDQDTVTNEYSCPYANRGANGGATAAGRPGMRSAFPGRPPSDGDEQEYAAIRDPNDGGAGPIMVENQLYIPFKE